MGETWADVIARLVADNGGSQSRLARGIGVPPQRVQSWLNGAEPSMANVRAVASATQHTLPYLISVAYGVPMRELAEGAGELLAHDGALGRHEREHIARQYAILARLTRLERGKPGD